MVTESAGHRATGSSRAHRGRVYGHFMRSTTGVGIRAPPAAVSMACVEPAGSDVKPLLNHH